MNTSLLSIETLLLARYAEVLPDATITMIGAGVSSVLHQEDVGVGLFVVATLLSDGPPGPQSHRLYCKMRSPRGDTALEMSVDVMVEGGARRRLPLVMPVPVPAGIEPGEWSIELSGPDELKVVLLTVEQPVE